MGNQHDNNPMGAAERKRRGGASLAHTAAYAVARSGPKPRPAKDLQFTVNDFVRFSRVVVRESKFHEPRIVWKRGSGIVLRISKSRRRIDGHLVTTGRVDAGRPLGVVTAVLDDAEVTATQLTL